MKHLHDARYNNAAYRTLKLHSLCHHRVYTQAQLNTLYNSNMSPTHSHMLMQYAWV